jgi:VanZ family protein
MTVNKKIVQIMFWVCICAVLFFSWIPGTDTALQFVTSSDKYAHFIAFFVLSVLLLFAYSFSKPFFSTVLFMMLFGLVIEAIQIFVPYRSFSLLDFGADLLGVFIALIIFRLVANKYVYVR